MSDPVQPEPVEGGSLDSAPSLDSDRDERIRQLEQRLARPPSVGVVPPVALVALIFSGLLLWGMQLDLAYYFSSREPIELGAEGDYRMGNAVNNRYVQIHGTPTGRGAYFNDGKDLVAIGLQNTPVMVIRQLLETEQVAPGKTPPRPDQRSFTVRGRLLAREDASKYEPAFASHAGWGEISPSWVIMAEQPPGTDVRFMLMFTALMVFALVNLWLLVRGVVALARRGR